MNVLLSGLDGGVSVQGGGEEYRRGIRGEYTDIPRCFLVFEGILRIPLILILQVVSN